jgi:hypothetical protein
MLAAVVAWLLISNSSPATMVVAYLAHTVFLMAAIALCFAVKTRSTNAQLLKVVSTMTCDPSFRSRGGTYRHITGTLILLLIAVVVTVISVAVAIRLISGSGDSMLFPLMDVCLGGVALGLLYCVESCFIRNVPFDPSLTLVENVGLANYRSIFMIFAALVGGGIVFLFFRLQLSEPFWGFAIYLFILEHFIHDVRDLEEARRESD